MLRQAARRFSNIYIGKDYMKPPAGQIPPPQCATQVPGSTDPNSYEEHRASQRDDHELEFFDKKLSEKKMQEKRKKGDLSHGEVDAPGV